MEEYNIKPLIQNCRDLAECRKCIYDIPQSGRFAYIKLVKHLSDDCHFPTGNIPGFFLRLTRPTTFNLVVDDFGTKIVGKHNTDHIINTF